MELPIVTWVYRIHTRQFVVAIDSHLSKPLSVDVPRNPWSIVPRLSLNLTPSLPLYSPVFVLGLESSFNPSILYRLYTQTIYIYKIYIYIGTLLCLLYIPPQVCTQCRTHGLLYNVTYISTRANIVNLIPAQYHASEHCRSLCSPMCRSYPSSSFSIRPPPPSEEHHTIKLI